MQLPLYETYGLIESGSVALNLPGSTYYEFTADESGAEAIIS